ncbi:MAG TPA: metallophosphoesterase [Solirubrobacterales bacterium]|nr:metallophosphoesterase [Solirubrobacterales bacterium]
MRSRDGALLAIGDLHVEHPENRRRVAAIEPGSDSDWLIVCGDVADQPEDVEWVLALLQERFATVVWVPGNHELLAQRDDPDELRGEARYRHLVEICRRQGVVTPEDPYPIWDGAGGPARVVPLFLLYDYSFGVNVGATPAEALRRARDAGVICVDEFLLDPAPYSSRREWCEARVEETERRLEELEPPLPAILVNHYPLLAEPTRVLRHPEFAQWCGTSLTADWHRRFRASAVVYGHLHIPRTTWHDGVRFEEVSLGYPRERRRWGAAPSAPRQILPEPRRA